MDDLVSTVLRELREAVNAVSNAGLQLDPRSESRLQALEGKTIRLDLLLPGREAPFCTMLSVRRARLELEPGTDATPHAIASGSPADFLAWIGPGSGAGSGGLQFSGDEVLLAELAELLTSFRPDLARPLTGLAGEAPVQTLLGVAEAGFAALRSVLQAAGSGVEDIAHDHYLGNVEFNRMMDNLDALQLRVDRLQARLQVQEDARAPADGNRP